MGFSFAASGIYTFNDIINRHEDKLHPIKRNRPVASGALSIRKASVISLLFFFTGMILLWLIDSQTMMVAGVYVVLMIGYTLFFRRILILDVIVIASGFVLRVVAGAVLIGEPLSHWLILCTFTIALFLGMIKRRQELGALREGGNQSSRSVLSDYPDNSIIDGWINILAGMTVLCYALYTVDPETIAKHHTSALIYTFPFVLYGIFRYMHLAQDGRKGEDPTNLVIKDSGIKIVVLLWGVTVGLILYLSRIV